MGKTALTICGPSAANSRNNVPGLALPKVSSRFGARLQNGCSPRHPFVPFDGLQCLPSLVGVLQYPLWDRFDSRWRYHNHARFYAGLRAPRTASSQAFL